MPAITSGLNDKKIGVASLTILFFNLAMAKFMLMVPFFAVKGAGNSAWMIFLLKGVAALLIFAAAAALYKPYMGLGLGTLSRESLGKFLGGAVNLIIVTVMTVRGGLLFRILAEALQTLESDDPTIEYTALFVLIPVVICAIRGFETNVNASILILPFTVISVVTIFLALIPHYNLSNIMPILGLGEGKILKYAFLNIGGAFEIIYLLILSRSVSDYKTFKRGGLIGIGAVFFVSFLLTLMYCLSVPYPASKNFFFPLYQLTRMIKAGSFLQRLEPTVIFIWTAMIICALSTLVIAGGELLKTTAAEKHSGGFVPLLVMIIFFIGALPKSELSTYDIYNVVLNFSHYFYIVVIFLIPICARLRKVERRLSLGTD